MFERQVKPCLKGRALLIRYADDFAIGFAYEEDARRVLEVLPKRFGTYGSRCIQTRPSWYGLRDLLQNNREATPRSAAGQGASTCSGRAIAPTTWPSSVLNR
jgi:hypothetical protein